jgi:phage gp45-like
MAETVMILPQRMIEETSISSSEVKSKEVDLEAIPETVMITPQGMTKGNSILSPAGMRREELEKTSLISPGGVGKEPPPSSIEVKKPEEVMAETVMILPQRMIEETSISSSEVKSKEVDLEAIPETVMITPQGMTKGNSILSPAGKSKEADLFQKNKEPPTKDEFLEETVILKPSKVRDKVNE